VPARRLIAEADGAARGNPGPASYGAVVRDAATGEVLAERGATLGTTTNNVAEYRGLIAALEAAFAIDAQAEVEVRMDSKLVIEQMAGRWNVKHANLKPLALQARALIAAPERVRWTWIPREQNAHADMLANRALDGAPLPAPGASTEVVSAQPAADAVAVETAAGPAVKIIGWATDLGAVTTLRLLRHGETAHTIEKRFSGVAHDPPLSDRGRGQAEATAAHLASAGGIDVIVSSPLGRALQTAQIVADKLGVEVEVEQNLRECAFGEWDGLTFGEVQERWPDELTAWLASPALAPPGGESLVAVAARVSAAQDRLLTAYAGRAVLVVAHVIPIKQLVRFALDAPPAVVHRLQLAPASLSTVCWYADGNAALHGFNDTGHLGDWARLDGS
jgi:ribonuclease H / adenosylcobalamin/alpha-ribazole phosphatase